MAKSDPTCLFCCEGESVNHLFFECCISSNVWSIVSEILGREVGKSYENTAGLWIANKRHAVTSAVLWAIWNVSWTGLMVLLKIVGLLRRWMALFRQEIGAKVGEFASRLEVRACSPPQILWRLARGDEGVIRVGTIGCSIFSANKCSFGSF